MRVVLDLHYGYIGLLN